MMDHSRFIRILRLLTALGSGRRYRIDELAKMFTVARRTVYRDLRLLKDVGVPYYYDRIQQCCKLEPHFSLSCLNLSKQEAFTLFLMVKMAKYLNFPLKNELEQAAVKIYNSLPGQIRQYCIRRLENITILPDAAMRIDRLDEFFIKLTRAIAKKQVVLIEYPADNNGYQTFYLEPYQLIYRNKMWYVTGKSRYTNSPVTISFNNIRKLELQSLFFSRDNNFCPNNNPINRNKLRLVRLKFAPEAAQEAMNIHWHENQTVLHNPDGSVIIEFYIDSFSEIKRLILSYAGLVEVLEPPVLREEIVTIAENIVNINR